MVLLFDPEAGVRQPKRQLAVVGEQHEAFGVDVEAPDGIHAPRRVHQLDDGGPALGIVRGADDAERLVERDVVMRGLAAIQSGRPSTSMRSRVGSTWVPSSTTRAPLTRTRWSRIIRSAARREATPA